MDWPVKSHVPPGLAACRRKRVLSGNKSSSSQPAPFRVMCPSVTAEISCLIVQHPESLNLQSGQPVHSSAVEKSRPSSAFPSDEKFPESATPSRRAGRIKTEGLNPQVPIEACRLELEKGQRAWTSSSRTIGHSPARSPQPT